MPQLFELCDCECAAHTLINRPDDLALDGIPKYILDRTIPFSAEHQNLSVLHWLLVRELFDGFARLGVRLAQLTQTHTSCR